MDLQLTGKNALVTGSTAGIGLAIAESLAREGAEVIVNGRTEERVKAAIEKLKAFVEITDHDWLRFFEVNVLSGVRLSRVYLPGVRARNWGRIIFVSRESAIQIPAEMIHRGMTKTAQLAVSRGLAETTGSTGVTVNAVLPGPTGSEGVSEFVDQLASSRNTDRSDVKSSSFGRCGLRHARSASLRPLKWRCWLRL